MSPIHNVATYLMENKQQLARDIANDVLKQIDGSKYKQEQIDETIVSFEHFIQFLGESHTNSEAKIHPDVIAWGRNIGEQNANAGNELVHSTVAYPYIRNSFITCLFEVGRRFSLSDKDMEFIIKKLNFILDIVLHEIIKAYEFFKNRIIKTAKDELSELTAPIVPIYRGVAVLPIIGAVDSDRAKYILEKVIPKVVDLKIEHLIIDFSGIHSLDTMVTEHVFRIHKVLVLLGIQASVTGIRPELAQTAVQIGIDLSSIKSYATVQQALETLKKD